MSRESGYRRKEEDVIMNISRTSATIQWMLLESNVMSSRFALKLTPRWL